MTVPSVLIVDDEPDLLDLVEITLVRMGLNVDRASDVAQAMARLAEYHYDLCLTDMRLSDGNGLDIVHRIGQDWPALPVAVITAFGSAENAVAALKAGAFDYLSKPLSLEQLRALVRTALKVPSGNAAPPEALQLVGSSPGMAQIRSLIAKLAQSQAPVFISGASGTGKEVAARLIHQQGRRSDRPFVAVNCGAIPENLMESEFFGYRKGAFTGAASDREGFFQAAHTGTLFLDEVADLPVAMQVKLLRAIQERKVRRLGEAVEEPLDVRIISASHQDLAEAVEQGRFRQDLYYRLNVIEMRMPPLGERPEDIPELVAHISQRLSAGSGTRSPGIGPGAMAALMRYSFPGNVRELENILERAFALGDGAEISEEDLGLHLTNGSCPPLERGEEGLQDYLDRIEAEAIQQALEATRGNKTAAARRLGVTFRSLRYRIDRLGLDKS